MKPLDIVKNGMFYWMRESYMALRKQGYGGIRLWQEIMEKALTAGYESAKAKRNSGMRGFLKHVVARDKMLGLAAGGKIIVNKKNHQKFSYWIVDPFLPLKDKISQEEYHEISTNGFLRAKIKYFLGEGWITKMIKTPWNGDKRTEWILEKKP
jgi:hypothetical protein